MGVMAWNFTGYENIIKGACENFKTEMPPELIMGKIIGEFAKAEEGKVFMRFYWMPLIIGRRGFDGSHFLGRFTYIKFLLISCVNWMRLSLRIA
jgi:hypothetical protein